MKVRPDLRQRVVAYLWPPVAPPRRPEWRHSSSGCGVWSAVGVARPAPIAQHSAGRVGKPNAGTRALRPSPPAGRPHLALARAARVAGVPVRPRAPSISRSPADARLSADTCQLSCVCVRVRVWWRQGAAGGARARRLGHQSRPEGGRCSAVVAGAGGRVGWGAARRDGDGACGGQVLPANWLGVRHALASVDRACRLAPSQVPGAGARAPAGWRRKQCSGRANTPAAHTNRHLDRVPLVATTQLEAVACRLRSTAAGLLLETTGALGCDI